MPIANAAFDMNQNHLLAALPPQDRERWRSCLQQVALVAGQVLQEEGQPPRYVYFPLNAVVSLLVPSEDGSCDEVGIVGREGMVGVSSFSGSDAPTMRAVVQSPGRALRLGTERIRSELEVSRAALRRLLQYVASQEVQLAQGVVCSRHHSVQQRLALRLLLGMECQQDNRLQMTHEQLAGWLGVRRESVTEEAHKLQKAGLVAYARGHITVVDRAGLERNACGCFGLITAECHRLEASMARQHPAGTEPPYGALRGVAQQHGVAHGAPG